MKRAALAAVATLAALIAPASAFAENRGTDILGGLSPGGLGGGTAGKYPLSAYSLDYYVDNGTFGVSSPAGTVSQWLADILWTVAAFLTHSVIGLLVWVLDLGVLNAAITPITQATQSIQNTLGGWTIVLVAVFGFWLLRRAVMERRYTEAAAKLAVTFAYLLLAALLVSNAGARTVTTAAHWTDQVSVQLLGGKTGAVSEVADRLFNAQIVRPWAILEFGGLRHCVDTDRMKDGFPTPVHENDPSRDVCRDNMRKGADGMGGYADRFLRQTPGSDERHAEYTVLAAGQVTNDPQFRGYRVDRNDSPAVDIQQEAAATKRAVLAAVILIAALGFVVLIGALAFGMVIAQVMVLGLLLLVPVMALAAWIPGPGHRMFEGWLKLLGSYVVRKAVYALVIFIVVTAAASLATVPALGGWAFVLAAAFYWAVILKHKAIVTKLTGSSHGGVSTSRVTQTAATARMVAAGGVGAAVATVGALRRGDDEEEREAAGQESAVRGASSQPTAPTPPAQLLASTTRYAPPATPEEAPVPTRTFKEDLEWERDKRYPPPQPRDNHDTYEAEPVPVENMQQSLERTRGALVARALSVRAREGEGQDG